MYSWIRHSATSLFFFAIFVAFFSSLSSANCINDSGEAVDWFIVLKSPQLNSSATPYAPQGLAYMYVDSRDSTGLLRLSSKSLGSQDSALGRTINQVYANHLDTQDYLWAAWNDEKPDGSTTSTYAHSKGVVWSSINGGFWIVHSTPRSFNITHGYEFPASGVIYGQSFMCLSLAYADMEVVASYMATARVWLFDVNFPSAWTSHLPTMSAVLTQSGLSVPSSAVIPFTSISGAKYTAFSKSPSLQVDLYSSIVQPFLQTGLALETWMRPALASCCSPTCSFDSLNIQALKWPGTDITYTETHDHSKYGFSLDSTKPFVCIGDLNRQVSQFSRGGGTVCFDDPNLWKQLSGMVVTEDVCS